MKRASGKFVTLVAVVLLAVLTPAFAQAEGRFDRGARYSSGGHWGGSSWRGSSWRGGSWDGGGWRGWDGGHSRSHSFFGFSIGFNAWLHRESARPSQKNHRLYATFHRVGMFRSTEKRGDNACPSPNPFDGS